MCDPVSAAVVGGAALAGSAYSAKREGDRARAEANQRVAATEAERQRAEAEAAQRANAKIVQDTRRRRQQQNLLALGDEGTDALGNPSAGAASPGQPQRGGGRFANLLASVAARGVAAGYAPSGPSAGSMTVGSGGIPRRSTGMMA